MFVKIAKSCQVATSMGGRFKTCVLFFLSVENSCENYCINDIFPHWGSHRLYTLRAVYWSGAALLFSTMIYDCKEKSQNTSSSVFSSKYLSCSEFILLYKINVCIANASVILIHSELLNGIKSGGHIEIECPKLSLTIFKSRKLSLSIPISYRHISSWLMNNKT